MNNLPIITLQTEQMKSSVIAMRSESMAMLDEQVNIALERALEDRAIWYLLFDGQTADGRGDAQYIGRTLDINIARKHALECYDNPYSTGYVVCATDFNFTRLNPFPN